MITIEIEQMSKRKRSYFRRRKDLPAVIESFGCSSVKSARGARKHILGVLFVAAGIAAVGFIKLNGII